MKNYLIVLDPGHSKFTKGKQSPDGKYKEYLHNRQLARFLSFALQDKGCIVKWTVSNENDLSLTNRATKANDFYKEFKSMFPDGQALFVSVHSNAAGDGSKWMNAEGWSIFTTKSQNNSDKAANIIWDAVKINADKWGMKMRRFSYQEKDYEENFTVIAKTVFPSVLIEDGFHDNAHDVELISNENYLADEAEAIAVGIINYFEKKR